MLEFNFLPEPPLLTPITFGEPTVFEGDLAQATCVLRKGDQPVTFSWMFDGVGLTQADGINVLDVGGRTSILTLDPVRAYHQGTYSCSATNAAGTAEVKAELNVIGTMILHIIGVGCCHFYESAVWVSLPLIGSCISLFLLHRYSKVLLLK